MRNLWVATVVASMILAPSAWSDPLTPGKPAGVHTAQFRGNTPIIIAGIAVAAVAIAVAASSGGNNSTPATTTITTTTTT